MANDDEFMQIKVNISLYSFSLIIFSLVLWNFRPRATLPDFYRMNMAAMQVRAGGAIPKKPILTFQITYDELFETQPFEYHQD
jgi:hypothetical protein